MQKKLYLFCLLLVTSLCCFGQCNEFTTVTSGPTARHTLGIKSDGTLWAWGENTYGQLGIGSTADQNVPIQVGSSSDWAAVSAGQNYTIAIKINGTLWAWGASSAGQLGTGTSLDQNVPAQVGSAANWKGVSAGGLHTVAIRTDGSLWAWGSNEFGQLGDLSYVNKFSPIRIGSAFDWGTVATGEGHSAAIKSDGSLWTWGRNNEGQLGHGSNANSNEPERVGNGNESKSACAGLSHTVGIKNDGTLWGWGYNGTGQLGSGSDLGASIPQQIGSSNNWASVSAGAEHNIGLRKDGTLWAWGQNTDGQLGDKSTTVRYEPVQVGSARNWTSLRAGAYHSLAINSDGRTHVWGADNFGQLGLGLNTNQNSPISMYMSGWAVISAGENYSIGLKHDGTLWGWGFNEYYQLNGVGGIANQNIPVQISNATDWKMISTGAAHTFAIKNDGTLWGWGYNFFGQIIEGGVNPYGQPLVQIGTATDWKSISTGSYHSMAIKTDGTLWAWGMNWAGQLGIGSSVDQGVPVQVGTATNWISISSGDAHSLGIKHDGTLWGWGFNASGQLGIGSTTTQRTPVQIGIGSDWISAECGYSHSLAIKSNNSLWAWGKNEQGELGLGSNLNQTSPIQVGSATDWKSVSGGLFQTLALRGEGLLFAWGRNNYGQLGIGSIGDQNVPVQVGNSSGWVLAESGGNHSIGIQNVDILFGWGRNNEGQAGVGSLISQNAPVQVLLGAAAAFPGRLTSSFTSVTMQQGHYNIFSDNCALIASVVANPDELGSVSGPVTAKVWIESNQPSQYVKRHYEITPTNNSGTVSGRIILYFSQADFDDSNVVGGWLPREPGDSYGIANLRIEKRTGTSSDNSGKPSTYNGTATTIDPVDTDIRWNTTAKWWEISLETSGFSGFFVKSTDASLPVKLQSFEANQSENKAHLNWQTAGEYNTSHFEVQRSTNALQFETIGRIQAAGNSSQQQAYTYTDEDFPQMEGNVYYRLRMVDSDSTFSISRIEVVARIPEIKIYPNPAPSGTTIFVEANAAISGLSVRDVTGAYLSGYVIEPQSGNLVGIKLPDLASGLYIIHFQAGGHTHIQKIWVQ